uniref:Phytocyanin domain-containing protein n=2 Tax=Aegilops tauschii TaxID=37682 RepID=A0A453LV88_AEGTS
MCDTRNPIHRYPGGGTHRGTTFVLLSEAKFYYFTCSVRYFCPAGMRLDIPVQERRRTPDSARDDTSGTAMVESSATSPAPGPRRSDDGVQGTKWADMESSRPGP